MRMNGDRDGLQINYVYTLLSRYYYQQLINKLTIIALILTK